MEYNRFEPWKTLDPWQERVLKAKGNLVLRSGRQVGKSTVISILAGDFAMENPQKEILIISKVERQAYHLFFKIKNYINAVYPNQIKGRATLTYLEMKNGAKIHCLPAGMDGEGIRGLTIDLLIADEAAFIPELVWTAVTPMMSITGGRMILLSTPHGKHGYFYERFNDDDFTEFHVPATECGRHPKEFLEKERKRLGDILYSQEYLGLFLDDLTQVYPDELIRECMQLRKVGNTDPHGKYYLGMDIAGMGEDLTTFEILELKQGTLYHRENITTQKQYPHETYQKCISLNTRYRFKKIYLDDGGLGVGVLGLLLKDNTTKRKTVGINNARRVIGRSKDGKEEKGKLYKEELHMNLRTLMEQGKIKLLKDEEVFQSLKSVQFEHKDGKAVKIFGRDTHIAEGLVRAAWGEKDKSLNIYVY